MMTDAGLFAMQPAKRFAKRPPRFGVFSFRATVQGFGSLPPVTDKRRASIHKS